MNEGLVVIVGKSGSGKDSILRIMKRLGFKGIVSHTTRPPRHYEENGVDYNFVDDFMFDALKTGGFFAETTSYTTELGLFRYGMPKQECNVEKVVVVNPDGLRQLDMKIGNVVVIYVKASDEVRLKRLNNRGDNLAEIQRRWMTDLADFMGIESRADFVFENDGEDFDMLEVNVKEFVEEDLRPYIEVLG